MGFPGGSDGKESTYNVGDLGLIPGLGRSPGGGHGNPLQYSCLENPHGQRSLAGYCPWGHKESDMTEWLSAHTDKRRGKGWDLEIRCWKYLPKDLFHQFPWSTECSTHLKECWQLAVAAARGSVTAEAAGKCPSCCCHWQMLLESVSL